MRKLLFLSVLTALMSGSAFAAAGPEKGWYVGGAIGVAEIDNKEAPDFSNADDSDVTFQAFGGYKFFKWLAVEGKVSTLGKYRGTIGQDVQTSIESNVITGAAKFILPFGESGWDIYGQVGLGIIKSDLIVSDDTFSKTTATEPVGMAGVGVRWSITPAFTLSAGIDAYASELDEEGEKADINIVTGALGLQYNF